MHRQGATRARHGVLLLALAAGLGCYAHRPVSMATVSQTPRLLVTSRDGVLFHTARADGAFDAGGCTVHRGFATLRAVKGDTLIVERVAELTLTRDSAPCARSATGVVAVVAQEDLRLTVVEPSAGRSFLAGMLAGPLLLIALLWAAWG